MAPSRKCVEVFTNVPCRLMSGGTPDSKDSSEKHIKRRRIKNYWKSETIKIDGLFQKRIEPKSEEFDIL
jgi:hypothetical protein